MRAGVTWCHAMPVVSVPSCSLVRTAPVGIHPTRQDDGDSDEDDDASSAGESDSSSSSSSDSDSDKDSDDGDDDNDDDEGDSDGGDRDAMDVESDDEDDDDNDSDDRWARVGAVGAVGDRARSCRRHFCARVCVIWSVCVREREGERLAVAFALVLNTGPLVSSLCTAHHHGREKAYPILSHHFISSHLIRRHRIVSLRSFVVSVSVSVSVTAAVTPRDEKNAAARSSRARA